MASDYMGRSLNQPAALFVFSETSVPEKNWLTIHNFNFDFIDFDSFLRDIEADPSHPADLKRQLTERWAQKYKYIWYHIGSFDEIFLDEMNNSADAAFSARQKQALLSFFEYAIDVSALCIDSPVIQRHWSNKLLQNYHFHHVLGSDALRFRVFRDIDSIPAGFVVKALSEGRRITAESAFYTTVVSDPVRHAFNGNASIFLAQQMVDSRYEYRAYFFERTVSVVIEMDRSSLNLGRVDKRDSQIS